MLELPLYSQLQDSSICPESPLQVRWTNRSGFSGVVSLSEIFEHFVGTSWHYSGRWETFKQYLHRGDRSVDKLRKQQPVKAYHLLEPSEAGLVAQVTWRADKSPNSGGSLTESLIVKSSDPAARGTTYEFKTWISWESVQEWTEWLDTSS